eukprot:14067209-Ditylum_brightwellii.AAC.1
MRGSSGKYLENDELIELIPCTDATTSIDHHDLLIPTQALPEKITKVQHKVNNGNHHGHAFQSKPNNSLRVCF